jgi:BirA family biotin operon repressor/biotin-[acetyl-CoA-carboxylase] ligase
MSEAELAPPALDASAMREAVGRVLIGREIVVVEQTRSTNDLVLAAATPDTAEGLVVFAESQTAGRGRHGNHWASAPRKGLWFSILLRPRIALTDSAHLTDWLADGVAKTIASQFQLPAAVKPPNDVYVGDRKVSGVLVEMRAIPNSPHTAIAGVGINVNQRAEDFPEEIRARAGSLAMHTGGPVDRQMLAVALLRDFDRTYAELFG